MMMVSYLVLLVSVLVGLAFLTLLERKVLGAMQVRLGPSKVSVVGLLQPFADGSKLLSKGKNVRVSGDKILFIVSPIVGMMLCFSMWSVYEIMWESGDVSMGIMLFFCLSGGMVYVMSLSGWVANSLYSLIGCCRGVAQAISYEVSSVLLGLGVVILMGGYKLSMYEGGIVSVVLILMVVWVSVCLAEVNRSPYDFVEGESELVSGFNVEYSSVGFSLLFMSEYGSILFVCYLSGSMFFGDSGGLFSSGSSSGVIVVRGGLPRSRYDKLMSMAWKYYLYFSLGFFVFLGGVVSSVGLS